MPTRETLHAKLRELEGLLSSAAEQSLRDEFREAFEEARKLVVAVRHSGCVDGPELERLARFIDDCLPWQEDVLRSWQRLERSIRREKSRG
jgi:hypothetical protein